MTGYGKAEGEFHSKKISIEVKSLNSKQLDLNLRVPSAYKEKELDLRNEISREMVRGKVDFTISLDTPDDLMQANINPAMIKSYYQKISDLSTELRLSVPEDIISTLIRMPDALKLEKQVISEKEWKFLFENVMKALGNLNEFRMQEGRALEKDLTDRIYLIDHLSYSLEPFETQRIEKLKLRIKNNLLKLFQKIQLTKTGSNRK